MGFKILTYQAFAPTDISGIKAWYDASTLTGADGSSVSSWLDQSGNEAHMYQSTSAAQPVLKTSVLNNRNVVRFDGVDDFLNLTAPFDQYPTNTGSFHNCCFSNSGNYFVHINGSTSPYVYIYKRDGNKFTKLGNPSSLPTGTGYQASWTIDDTYLCIAHATAPRVTIYKRSGDTFTKLSDPALLPTGTMYGCDFSNDSTYLAVAGSTTGTERLIVYKRSGDTFTDLAVSSGISSGTAWGCKFSPNYNFLVVGTNSTPFMYIYSRSGDVFTAVTAPTTLPSAEVYSFSWLSDTVFAVCGSFSSILIYEWNGTKFELQQTISFSTGLGYDLSYSKNKNYLALATTNSTAKYMIIYKISGSTYTPISNPLSTSTGSGRGIAWNNDDSILALSNNGSINVNAYKRSGDTFTNMNRLNLLRNVGGMSVFAVVKYPKNNLQNDSFIAANGAGAYRIILYQRNTTNVYTIAARRLDADAGTSVQSSTTPTGTNFDVHSGVINYSNTTAVNYVNGTNVASSTSFSTVGNTSDTDSTFIRLGGTTGEYLNGDIAEIIVYNRALSDNEIKNVHQYLGRKWGITIA